MQRQFHNGKQAGFIRKKYRSIRSSLGKAKQSNIIYEIGDKEQRWIKYLNHKISRQPVKLAVQEKVGFVVMEELKNIRKTAISLKRTDKTIHSWAFYQLQQFIEYKARLM